MSIALSTAFGGVMHPDIAQKMFINIAGRDAPLTASLMQLNRKERTGSTTLVWRGHDLAVRRDQVDNEGGYNASATEITVTDGSVFAASDVVLVEATGELMLVTAVTGEDLTVVRGIGTVEAASIADEAFLLNVGPAKVEASTGSPMRTNETVAYTSYTQIFERKLTLSATLAKVNTATEDERMRLRGEQLKEISRDMELAALFGQPGQRTVNGKPHRTTMGVLEFALANVQDANGTLTEPELDDWLAQLFEKGSGYRLMFGSGHVCNIVRRLKKPIEQGNVDQTRVGFTASRFAMPFGEFDLIWNPHLTGEFANELLAVDPEEVAIRHIQERDLRLIENVQANDDDAFSDKWLAEMGLTWGNPNTHGRLTNIVQAG